MLVELLDNVCVRPFRDPGGNIGGNIVRTKGVDRLPSQVAFELHTRGANLCARVAHEGQGLREYERSFLGPGEARLDRIIDKTLCYGDKTCAEFVLVRIEDKAVL